MVRQVSPISHRPTDMLSRASLERNPIYGPGVGIGRLERWKRANKLDLQPPQEVGVPILTRLSCSTDTQVRQILETRQGQEDARLKMHGIGL